MEKKKNSKPFIIPASYFSSKGIKPVAVNIPKKEETVAEPIAEKYSEKTKIPAQVDNLKESKPIPSIDLKIESKQTSGFSLKSIQAKKEHQIRQMEVVVDPNDLPREPVEQEDLTKAWNAYSKILDLKGERIMVSILEMGNPRLNGNNIQLEFPNETLKIELERAQFPLMEYLRKALKNYDLTLDISVNVTIEKQYAFTPMEKYQKMKEKNPNIELLKKTFGLDL